MEVTYLAASLALLVVLYWTTWSVYSLFFHPLARYPGPRLAAISELWYARSWVSGYFVADIHELHLRHGPVVRIAPNELSFGSPQAVKDIYGPATKGRKVFVKSDKFYDTGGLPPNISFEINPEKHAVRRKLLLPGFRGQSLALQEKIVHEHVDLMLEKLGQWGKQSPDGTVNMSDVHEWLSFDIIGQLVFGESFGAIAQGRSHEWVSSLLFSLYNDSVYALRTRIPALGAVLAVVPYISTAAAKNVEQAKYHASLSLERVRKRIGREDTETPDIFQQIIQKGNLTEEEMLSEAMILIAAGAETTPTALVAIMWYLLSNPQTLSKLQHEVRSTFSSQSSITGDSVAKLPYLNAVIEEALRIFAPVPHGMPRKSPGAIVDGNYIPAGVYVSAQMWHVHRNPDNVPDPEKFDPERWLDSGFSATKSALAEEEGEQPASLESAEKGQNAGTGKKKKPFTAPFILGSRGCLGINLAYLEMRITIAKLAYVYDWAFPEGYLESGADWPVGCRLMQLWSVPALNIKFTKA